MFPTFNNRLLLRLGAWPLSVGPLQPPAPVPFACCVVASGSFSLSARCIAGSPQRGAEPRGVIPLPLGAGTLAAFQGVVVYSYLSDCFLVNNFSVFLLPVVTAAFAPGDPVGSGTWRAWGPRRDPGEGEVGSVWSPRGSGDIKMANLLPRQPHHWQHPPRRCPGELSFSHCFPGLLHLGWICVGVSGVVGTPGWRFFGGMLLLG